MICVFEDDGRDLLSTLFCTGYENTSNFVYSKGNTKLVKTVRELLNNNDDTIVVYIDLLPDNRMITSIYGELSVLCSQFPKRLFVIPCIILLHP